MIHYQEYTLTPPPPCPTNQDHLNVPPAELEERFYRQCGESAMVPDSNYSVSGKPRAVYLQH